MTSDLISIVMPVFNGEEFIETAIQSVFSQTHRNWELLIINDGSTDGTESIIRNMQDPRIRYFEQSNKGVSAARNMGLRNMLGDYFCFVDADDILPPKSLSLRLNKFREDEELQFVDGVVVFFNNTDGQICRTYKPNFQGSPLSHLFFLKDSCFAGLTWMVRRQPNFDRYMRESLTHGEDLLYYMELTRQGGKYDYVSEEILYYRQHEASAMRNIFALEKGYWDVFAAIRSWPEFKLYHRITYRFKVKKSMALEYLKQNEIKAAFLILLK